MSLRGSLDNTWRSLMMKLYPVDKIAQYVKVIDCAIPYLPVKYSTSQLRFIDLHARPLGSWPPKFDDVIMETSERHDLLQERINGLRTKALFKRYRQARLKEQYCRRRRQVFLLLAHERPEAAYRSQEHRGTINTAPPGGTCQRSIRNCDKPFRFCDAWCEIPSELVATNVKPATGTNTNTRVALLANLTEGNYQPKLLAGVSG
ncbi:hypothetical protein EI94DRAFT_1711596 [Lactarius quietus]|nr:hypothetical protein EI94DRAFT_1711596 [Lactarius quietus]